MAIKKTKITIDGTTIKDDSSASDPRYLFNWEYEKTISGGISEMIINVPQTINNLISLSINQEVLVYQGFTTSTDELKFKGNISEISPDGGKITITCKDKMWALIRKNVNKVYDSTIDSQAGQISEIMIDLIETYGGQTADVTATGTGTGQTISVYRCINTDIYERLMALAEAVDYQVYYDASTDKIKCEPYGNNESGVSLTVGSEILGLPKWKVNTSKLINDLRIDGSTSETQLRFPDATGNGIIGTTSDFDDDGITLTKTPENVQLIMENANPPTEVKIGGTKDSTSGNFFYVDRENKIVKPATGSTFTAGHRAIVNYTWLAPAPVHLTDDESIENYGSSEKAITLSDIVTISDAEARAQEILSKYSEPFLIGEPLVKDNGDFTIDVGDIVQIIDNVSKPNRKVNLVITKQLIKYPSSNQELIVGDEAMRLSDWQFKVETRLKRLEEQFTTNQDILLELFNFSSDIQMQPRYQTIQTTEYDSESGISIWGAGTSDGFFDWGSGLWGIDDDALLDADDYFIQQYNNIYEETFIDEDFKGNSTGGASWESEQLVI